MKTTRQWFNKLQEPHRSRAIVNTPEGMMEREVDSQRSKWFLKEKDYGHRELQDFLHKRYNRYLPVKFDGMEYKVIIGYGSVSALSLSSMIEQLDSMFTVFDSTPVVLYEFDFMHLLRGSYSHFNKIFDFKKRAKNKKSSPVHRF